MLFSWKGLLLAPLGVPLAASIVMASLLNGDGPVVLPFLIMLIPACVISYATTIFLFLPALFLFSQRRPVTGPWACALGFALGTLMIVPMTALAWKSSGPDSGPPVESFFSFFAHWVVDPFNLFFPAAGLLTAALYWWLGMRRHHLPAKDSAPQN